MQSILYGVQMNFSWISYEIKSYLLIWIYMQFVWNSWELHIEELMKLIWYTHVIQTSWCGAHNQFTWNTNEIHKNFEWFEFHLNFIWTSWELHDKHTRSSCVLHMNMVPDILAIYFIWMSLQVHRSIVNQSDATISKLSITSWRVTKNIYVVTFVGKWKLVESSITIRKLRLRLYTMEV